MQKKKEEKKSLSISISYTPSHTGFVLSSRNSKNSKSLSRYLNLKYSQPFYSIRKKNFHNNLLNLFSPLLSLLSLFPLSGFKKYKHAVGAVKRFLTETAMSCRNKKNIFCEEQQKYFWFFKQDFSPLDFFSSFSTQWRNCTIILLGIFLKNLFNKSPEVLYSAGR